MVVLWVFRNQRTELTGLLDCALTIITLYHSTVIYQSRVANGSEILEHWA